MIRKRIEEKAKEVLRRFKVEEAYVPVDTIAEKLGLRIQKYDFGEDVSGVLVIDKGIGTIGINPSESLVRTRFTIAHEIGHYILHGNKNDSLFIDKNFKVHFRDQSSSTGEIRNEQEANAFAAALLMPEEKVKEQIIFNETDLGSDENAIKVLADSFGVSEMAMSYRIANLRLI